MDLYTDDVKSENSKKQSYQAPEIIYEGVISTRAGTPTDPGGPGFAPADPVDLFGDG